jgi:hypothetical protein
MQARHAPQPTDPCSDQPEAFQILRDIDLGADREKLSYSLDSLTNSEQNRKT